MPDSQSDGDALRRAYEDATIGKQDPAAGMCSGALLNHLLLTDKYDEDAWYFVSADGGIVRQSEE